jgi:hypothetical protein
MSSDYKYNIAVILPSRGLAFSQTIEEILNNLYGYKYTIYFSHGLPIPDCFNKPLEKALSKREHTHFWFVEDDMVLPDMLLTQMLTEAKHAVAVDYPVTKEGVGAIQTDSQGKALFTGTGCLLVQRSFLERLKRPVFRDDVRWDVHITPQGIELKRRISKTETYGMHDVSFGLECYRRGKPIHVLDHPVGQRKLRALGQAGTNKGQHNIEMWTKVKKSPNFIDLTFKPQDSALIAIKLKSGEITNVSKETANRMVKNGLATRIKYDEVSFV